MSQIKAMMGLFALLASAFAYALQPMTIEYDLYPNKPVSIINSTTQTVKSMCSIVADSSITNTLLIRQLTGSGLVNGTTLKRGQSLFLTVNNMQTLTVIQNSKSEIEFNNIGSFVIKAFC